MSAVEVVARSDNNIQGLTTIPKDVLRVTPVTLQKFRLISECQDACLDEWRDQPPGQDGALQVY